MGNRDPDAQPIDQQDALLLKAAKALLSLASTSPRRRAGAAKRARDLLAPLLFATDDCSVALREARRAEIIDLLAQAAGRCDPGLASLMAGTPAPRATSRSARVLQAFYFTNLGSKAPSLGDTAASALCRLKRSLRRERTFGADDFLIEFLKRYSSYTPILPAARTESVGGGYFLALGGTGCVVDPGHNFLDNFFRQRRSVADIDCVFVTHCHDDHWADLPALLSLLNHRWRGNPAAKLSLFVDPQTFEMFRPIITHSNYITEDAVLGPASTEWTKLNDRAQFRALPTKHEVLGENGRGVGLAFKLKDRPVSQLVITGDTGWDDLVKNAYKELRGKPTTLVAHLSSLAHEEVLGAFYPRGDHFYAKHLGVHGVCKAIEAVQPKEVVLSEVGEELGEVVGELAHTIERVYDVRCSVCHIGLKRFL